MRVRNSRAVSWWPGDHPDVEGPSEAVGEVFQKSVIPLDRHLVKLILVILIHPPWLDVNLTNSNYHSQPGISEVVSRRNVSVSNEEYEFLR